VQGKWTGPREREAITAHLGPRRRETPLFYRRRGNLVVPVQAFIPTCNAQPGSKVVEDATSRNAAVSPGDRGHLHWPGIFAIAYADVTNVDVSPRHTRHSPTIRLPVRPGTIATCRTVRRVRQ
jgi:hypothetical protein